MSVAQHPPPLKGEAPSRNLPTPPTRRLIHIFMKMGPFPISKRSDLFVDLSCRGAPSWHQPYPQIGPRLGPPTDVERTPLLLAQQEHALLLHLSRHTQSKREGQRDVYVCVGERHVF